MTDQHPKAAQEGARIEGAHTSGATQEKVEPTKEGAPNLPFIEEGESSQGEAPDDPTLPFIGELGLRSVLVSDLGEHRAVVERMAYSLRQAWKRADEAEWDKVDLADKLRDAEAGPSAYVHHRVLAVLECDGSLQLYADPTVTIRVVTPFPWEKSHDMMLDEKSHWRDVWVSNRERVGALPNSLGERMTYSTTELAEACRWQNDNRLIEGLKDFANRVNKP